MSSVLRVFDSDANFLLVRFRDARATLEAARDAGLLVRDFSQAPQLEGCLRISIGTPEQNERLLAAVERS
jgi:histidinol-phosphate aminotransferase